MNTTFYLPAIDIHIAIQQFPNLPELRQALESPLTAFPCGIHHAQDTAPVEGRPVSGSHAAANTAATGRASNNSSDALVWPW